MRSFAGIVKGLYNLLGTVLSVAQAAQATLPKATGVHVSEDANTTLFLPGLNN